MDFSKNSLRMRLHNIRPFIVPITEFIDIPVVAEISDLPAHCTRLQLVIPTSKYLYHQIFTAVEDLFLENDAYDCFVVVFHYNLQGCIFPLGKDGKYLLFFKKNY